jgi:hypothetical protein
MKKIAEKTFTEELIWEGSWGAKPAGKYESTMTLYEREDGDYFIEWDIPDMEDTWYINLELEGINVIGYDGIMSIPDKAIELLKENGFNTEEVE